MKIDKDNYYLLKLFGLFLIICFLIVMLPLMFFQSKHVFPEEDRDYVFNNDQSAALVLSTIDEGILGGSTKVYLQYRILGLIPYRKVVFTGRFGSEPEIKWVNNNEFIVNGKKGVVPRGF